MVKRDGPIANLRREQKRRKIKKITFAILLIGINVFIYLAVSALFLHMSAFKIEHVAVTGITGGRADEVRKVARGYIEERSYFIFPKYTMVRTPRDIESRLKGTLPWVEDVTASLGRPNTLYVGVTERKPAYLACLSEARNVCYYADRETLVFAEAPAFSAPVYIELSVPWLVSTSSPIMVQLFSGDTPADLIRLRNGMKEINLNVRRFLGTPDGPIRIYTDGGWYVLISKDESVERIMSSITAVTRSDKFTKELSDSRRSLEYIDVRLADKVFYKFVDVVQHE